MSLSIAMIGTRGLPATFGGVEHHVEQIGQRLVERGHRVTVYSESGYAEDPVEEYLGMRVVTLRSVPQRSLEALTHAGVSTLAAIRDRADVLHYHAVGPGVMTPIPRSIRRGAVVQTVHGLDADRDKWGGVAQRMLQGATWLSARVPHRTITVSPALSAHYAWRYNRSCTTIVNGTTPRAPRPPSLIAEKWGLTHRGYILAVGRLVPEKRADLLIEAFRALETDLRLVIVGGSSYTDDFVEKLETMAAEDPRVVLTGYAFGDLLDELFTNAAVFVQASDLEGLPLTVLEAIGSKLPVVASDIEPHCEILGFDRPGGRLFSAGDARALTETLRLVLKDVESEHEGALIVRDDALADYDWDACTNAVEATYLDALDIARHPRRSAP